MQLLAFCTDVCLHYDVQMLALDSNRIGDDEMCSFSDTLPPVALAGLRELELWGNKIGDDGMKALATAIMSGVLESLEELIIDDGNDHSALKDACQARRINLT